MKKLFISADMEGCAGVASQQALLPERWSWEWTAARRWMTQEVVSVAKAAFAANYDEVIVADSHGNAHNLEPDLLPENVWLVRGWPRALIHMEGIQDPDVKACAFIGYHAAAGAQDSTLSHTYHGAAFREIRVNGEVCSEGYLNAAVAGEFGIPVVLVSGDQHTVDDAKRYAPEAVLFAAKHAVGWRCQKALGPRHVGLQLEAAASQAFNRHTMKPFLIPAPYVLEIDMMTQVCAEMLSYLPNVERVNAFTISTKLVSLQAILQFVAFSMLYSPTGVAL
jgi:D-amino peptidase